MCDVRHHIDTERCAFEGDDENAIDERILIGVGARNVLSERLAMGVAEGEGAVCATQPLTIPLPVSRLLVMDDGAPSTKYSYSPALSSLSPSLSPISMRHFASLRANGSDSPSLAMSDSAKALSAVQSMSPVITNVEGVSDGD